MRRPFVRGAALAGLSLLAACTSLPRPADTTPPTLLLVSVDALSPSYLGKGDTPNLDRIASEGVRAEWMNPSYPSLTFPNHYTLVTGLRPDHHGIIHNTMSDPVLGHFRVGDEVSNRPSEWWDGAEPLWVTAEKQGLKTANWAWPGSVAKIHGLQPSQLHLYDEKIPAGERADTVGNWLLQTPAPRLVAMYFEQVDGASHNFGPRSAQTREALHVVDAAIGQLTAQLERAGKLDQVNVVVVSDHGMAEVAPGNNIAIEDMVSKQEASVTSIGQVVGINPNPGYEAQVEKKLLGMHAHYQCWRKNELPTRWHYYGGHPRVPAIVCQMQEGWDALLRSTLERRRGSDHARGSHGYDPALASMRASFIARGPAFKRGAVIPPIDNVDVYPLLARLIGVQPLPNDGNPQALLPALKQP